MSSPSMIKTAATVATFAIIEARKLSKAASGCPAQTSSARVVVVVL